MRHAQKLTEDGQKRLEELAKEWDATSERGGSSSAICDLRLMLEHFHPLQVLIRDISATEPQIQTAAQQRGEATDAEVLDAVLPDPERVGEPDVKWANTQRELQEVQQELVVTQAKRTELEIKFEACSKELLNFKRESKHFQSQLQQITEKLTVAQSRILVSSELSFLRRDSDLARGMGLDNLPEDDTHALIQVVAILSQLDNLKRLWELLRDRCENDKRSVTEDELALLRAALAWQNYNWRNLSYRLIEVPLGNRYDYETQLRSRHITRGDIVAALHLPGIIDGAEKILCKALVWTQ